MYEIVICLTTAPFIRVCVGRDHVSAIFSEVHVSHRLLMSHFDVIVMGNYGKEKCMQELVIDRGTSYFICSGRCR